MSKLSVILICFILWITINSLPISSDENASNIIYVDDDGAADYTKIQDAIDNANQGDTIFVYDGIYYENVVVDKTINLIGEDKEKTVVDGGGISDTILITADGVTVKGFNVTNSGDYSGGIIIDADRVTIENNTIFSHIHMWATGILIKGSNNHLFQNLLIKNFLGIYIVNSQIGTKDNRIHDNLIIDCDGNGILISLSSQSNMMYNNTITDCGAAGIAIDSSSKYNVVLDNFINLCGTGIRLGYASKNCVFQNTFLNNSYAGIDMGSYTYDNLAFHNNFINNGYWGKYQSYDWTGRNQWYAPYPIGGNYWDDYFNGTDLYHGEDQDIPSGDGIWDEPYIVSGSGRIERYPFVDFDGWKNQSVGPRIMCFGDLNWELRPGSIKTTSFYVQNIGSSSTELSWEIEEYPEWGDWKFEPVSGQGLKPTDGMQEVTITLTAPDKFLKEFTGAAKIVNSDNESDCFVFQSRLKTSKSRIMLNFLQSLLKDFQSFISAIQKFVFKNTT